MARFNFVKIVVRDIAAMERFYTEGVGCGHNPITSFG